MKKLSIFLISVLALFIFSLLSTVWAAHEKEVPTLLPLNRCYPEQFYKECKQGTQKTFTKCCLRRNCLGDSRENVNCLNIQERDIKKCIILKASKQCPAKQSCKKDPASKFYYCCPNNEDLCDGKCYDLNISSAHCGDCNTKCASGYNCCKGECRDVNNDNKNCGKCNNICKTGQACCGGTCVNLNSNANHCGGCGKNCSSNEICCGGKCLPSNAKNCGICGNVCPAGKSCCGVGPQAACVDTQNNHDNCGRCGNQCPADANCANDTCTCKDSFKILCDNYCVNLSTDSKHCGGCYFHACASDEICCGGKCIKYKSDGQHCGSCNNACATNNPCCEGVCCAGTCLYDSETGKSRCININK